MSPIRRSALAEAVSGALTSEKPFGSLLIANPVSRVSYGNVRKSYIHVEQLQRSTALRARLNARALTAPRTLPTPASHLCHTTRNASPSLR